MTDTYQYHDTQSTSVGPVVSAVSWCTDRVVVCMYHQLCTSHGCEYFCRGPERNWPVPRAEPWSAGPLVVSWWSVGGHLVLWWSTCLVSLWSASLVVVTSSSFVWGNQWNWLNPINLLNRINWLNRLNRLHRLNRLKRMKLIKSINSIKAI